MKSVWKKSAVYQVFAVIFLALFLAGGAVKGMWLESLPAWERQVMVLDSAQALALAAAFSFVCAMGCFVRGNRASLYLFEACIVYIIADLSQLVMWILLPEDMLQSAYAEDWGSRTTGTVLVIGVAVMLAWIFLKARRTKKGKE